MKNLFEASTVEEVITRVERLRPDAPRQWGKLAVAEMMAHCSTALEMASGKFVAKRTLLGRISRATASLPAHQRKANAAK